MNGLYEIIIEYKCKDDIHKIFYYLAPTVESANKQIDGISKGGKNLISLFVFECIEGTTKKKLVSGEINCEETSKFSGDFFKKNMKRL